MIKINATKTDLKFVIACLVSMYDLKKIVQKDVNQCLQLSKYGKHLGRKKIKRRNTKKETVYKEQHKKVKFWDEVRYYKENLSLFNFDKELLNDDYTLERAYEVIKMMVSHRVTVDLRKSKKRVFFKVENKQMNYNNFMKKELEKKETAKKEWRKKECEKHIKEVGDNNGVNNRSNN